jgi:hypothetical protein
VNNELERVWQEAVVASLVRDFLLETEKIGQSLHLL